MSNGCHDCHFEPKREIYFGFKIDLSYGRDDISN